MADRQFDTIVIGTGAAGQTAASELAQAGQSVAIVDARAYGGTCALRGCEPKKVLFSAAETVEHARGQAGHGVEGDLGLDWAALVAFKRGFTSGVPERIEGWLGGLGIELVRGSARFVAPDALEVDGARFSADHFVVATGAVPMPLGIEGAELVIDSEAFMELAALPERVAFVGGGFISFEFAHIAQAAGAHATIIHRSASVLRGFDPDLVASLVEAYRARGMAVLTNAPVRGVRRAGAGLEVLCEGGAVVACDLAVHGAGRVPDLEGLDLAAAQVAVGRHGIMVDPQMRSATNPRVFAAGDAAALGAPLTPVATAQGRIAARAIRGSSTVGFDGAITPSVLFADPPLASVGLTEVAARESGLDVEVRLTDAAEWASTRRVGADVGGAKTIVDKATGRVVGAHLLGSHAEEVINVFAAAMRGGLTADELREAVWAYPSAASEIAYLL